MVGGWWVAGRRCTGRGGVRGGWVRGERGTMSPSPLSAASIQLAIYRAFQPAMNAPRMACAEHVFASQCCTQRCLLGQRGTLQRRRVGARRSVFVPRVWRGPRGVLGMRKAPYYFREPPTHTSLYIMASPPAACGYVVRERGMPPQAAPALRVRRERAVFRRHQRRYMRASAGGQMPRNQWCLLRRQRNASLPLPAARLLHGRRQQ